MLTPMMMVLVMPMIGSRPADRPKIEALLDAIQKQETGGCVDPAHAVGDDGRSRGWYQIQYAYWLDTRRPGDPRDRESYFRDTASRTVSRQVVLRYWSRYCPKALERGDLETLARVHNGGPAGHRVRATRSYWHNVRKRIVGLAKRGDVE